jgi:hypothetical protein
MPFAVIFVYLLFALIIGTWGTDYALWAIAGQDIPIVGDALIGLFFSGITVPAAILCWLLGVFGATLPLFAS